MGGLLKDAVEYIVFTWKNGTQQPESVFLIIAFAFLSVFATWFIMEKIILPSKILELNNKSILMDGLKEEMDLLKNENEELRNENKKLKEEILRYSFIKSSFEKSEDFEEKALEGFVKN